MPEGHTIHRAARDHARDLVGAPLAVSSPQGRFEPGSLAEAAKLVRVEAWGKHLFYVFDRGRTVHVHLGLFGKFRRHRSPASPPRDTVRLRLAGERWTVDLTGPTACERVSAKEKAAILARLGPDPLRADADVAAFVDRLARSKTPIGAALLDQSVVAGVGNVYRAEVLHLLRMHPDTPCAALSRADVEALWTLLVGLLHRGVEEGRIVTTQGVERTSKKRVPRAEATHVYGRRSCRSCQGPVARRLQRARTLWYCERCQARAGAAAAAPPPRRLGRAG